jgi:hypothetical protein
MPNPAISMTNFTSSAGVFHEFQPTILAFFTLGASMNPNLTNPSNGDFIPSTPSFYFTDSPEANCLHFWQIILEKSKIISVIIILREWDYE